MSLPRGVLAAAVAAVAVLAAAIGAGHGAVGGRAHQSSWAIRVIADGTFVLEVGVVVALVVTLVFVVTSRGGGAVPEARPQGGRRPWWKRAAGFAGALALAWALARGLHQRHQASLSPVTAPPSMSSQPSPTPHAPAPRPDAAPILGVMALVAGAAGVLWYRGTRARGTPVRAPTDQDDGLASHLAEGIRTGVEELEREPDPRRAVILSYVSMERILGDAGWPRARAEAPLEYLARVLAAGGVSETAATRLTDLYERAGFGQQPVTEAMRVDALGALHSIRAELPAVPA